MDRPELAAFLRSRRARLRPADVGLAAGPRRRTPGLRRAEVAALAGMSVDYCIRLEQARGPHPSRQVLAALGRALRLSSDERAHLFHLAGQHPGPSPGPAREVPAGVAQLLASLPDTPAVVIDAKHDVLAWNPMAAALFTDFSALAPAQRNLFRQIFTNPAARASLSQEELAGLARDAVAFPEADQRLLLYTAAPGTPSHAALQLLKVVGIQELTW